MTITWDREDTNSNWRIYVEGEFHCRAGMVEGFLIDKIEQLHSDRLETKADAYYNYVDNS